MRSHAELLEASGYASRPKDFDDLLRILDSEIRLITPTDPEGKEAADESTSQAQPGQKYYQLTHDYLVPSLRDWLTRKQKETSRGRAELLLADRAAVWNARPENRQLPSLLQWLQIRWLTQKKNWTPPQRKMMRRRAGIMRCGGWWSAACLIVLGLVGWEGFGRLKAHDLARSAAGSQHGRGAGHRQGHGSVSPLARSAAARSLCPGREGKRPPQATARQPCPVAGGPRAGGVPVRPAAQGRSRRKSW